jgi:hypothetical protein
MNRPSQNRPALPGPGQHDAGIPTIGNIGGQPPRPTDPEDPKRQRPYAETEGVEPLKKAKPL